MQFFLISFGQKTSNVTFYLLLPWRLIPLKCNSCNPQFLLHQRMLPLVDLSSKYFWNRSWCVHSYESPVTLPDRFQYLHTLQIFTRTRSLLDRIKSQPRRILLDSLLLLNSIRFFHLLFFAMRPDNSPGINFIFGWWIRCSGRFGDGL